MAALHPNAAGKNQFNAMELLVSKYKCLQQRKMVNKAPLLRFCFHIPSVFKPGICEAYVKDESWELRNVG